MSNVEAFKPCPFCGGKVELSISDHEGNDKNEEYENDPWSGLSFKFQHPYEENEDCPIANNGPGEDSVGVYLYDSREEAIESWNKRVK